MAAKGGTGISAGLTWDGEKEFKNAISEMNQGLKVLGSEMALVTQSYKNNADSLDALNAKNDVLSRQIFTQKDKVVELEKALQASAEKYGEADKRTQNWQISLNKAQTDLIKMEDALKDGNQAVEEAAKKTTKLGDAQKELSGKTGGLGSSIGGLTSALGINLPRGADQAIKGLDGVKVSTLALVGATAAVVKGLFDLTKNAADTADELLEMSSKTSIAVGTLQELKYAAEFVDVDLNTLTTALPKLTKSMDAARRGSADTAEAFRKLGVRTTSNHGALRKNEEVFYDVIDALSRVSNETERDALAMKLLGKSATELNPLIEEGSKRLKELGTEARAMGYVMSNTAINDLGILKDKMDMFDKQTETLKNSLAMVMLPVLSQIFEMLNKVDPKMLATIAITAAIAMTIISVIKAVSGLVGTAGALGGFFSVANNGFAITALKVVAVVAALIALAAIIAIILGKGNELSSTMNSIGKSVGDMTTIVSKSPGQIDIRENARGTSDFEGGLTWVGEEGPEIIDLPPHTKIYSNARSRQIAAQGAANNAGGDTYVINVNANQLQEVTGLLRAFEDAKRLKRQGGVTVGIGIA